MTTDQPTRDALDLRTLKLPPSPPVVEVSAEDYTDSTGEPALRVQVILDESTDIYSIKGDHVSELKFAIGDSLRRHGVMLFPYIFLAKRSELLEAASED